MKGKRLRDVDIRIERGKLVVLHYFIKFSLKKKSVGCDTSVQSTQNDRGTN